MWFAFACLASAFWGLTYVFQEQILKQISVPTALAIEGLIFAAAATIVALLSGSARADLATLDSSPRLVGYIAAGTAALIVAEFFIGLSISSKNASLAGLIEISYPLFIALFAYLLFKEGELTLPIVAGGALILAGVVIIYWFAR